MEIDASGQSLSCPKFLELVRLEAYTVLTALTAVTAVEQASGTGAP